MSSMLTPFSVNTTHNLLLACRARARKNHVQRPEYGASVRISKIITWRLLTCLHSSTAQFQTYFQPIINAFRNPRNLSSTFSSIASTPEAVLNSARNINRQQLVTLGVIGAETLGFFTVGTMIGRLKIVGYHGEVHHEH